MTENNINNSQNPSGIWQGIWGNLFLQFNIEMMENNYLRAWKTLQLLKSQIPPECEKEVNTEYDKVNQIIQQKTKAYTTTQRNRLKRTQLNNEAPSSLLHLMSCIRQSLYDKHWINKPDFNAHPRNTQEAHIGE